MHAKRGVINVLDTRGIVHVDEIEHAPSVPEFRGIVEIRFRENATVAFVPMLWRHDESRVANLQRRYQVELFRIKPRK